MSGFIDFNPRSHERSDVLVRSGFRLSRGFQSTLPREERRGIFFNDYIVFRFQSTLPREERLPSEGAWLSTICISIHAPTRGATLFVAVKVWYPIFQSTLPREERLCAGFSLYLCTDFNPRSHERSDMRSVTQKCINCEFQSTLPREERHAGGANDGDQSDISIHAPTRGATFSSCHKCKL